MPLFEISGSRLLPHGAVSFSDLQLRERDDLQRLLRDDISPIDPELLVIAEEFGNWEDARRRIDLLAIDKAGRLVVIELKRTEDGGHMELQAVRYAAMVSGMQVEEVVAVFQDHLEGTRDERVNARRELSTFLEQDEDSLEISSGVRIVLVSRDFGREITTAVLWLNEFEPMDIRCFRLVPYEVNGSVLLDVQQIVPLPEAQDYQVRLRRKGQERERTRGEGRDFTRFHVVVDGEQLADQNKRRAVLTMVKQLFAKGCDAERIAAVLGPRKFRGVDGEVLDPKDMAEQMELTYPEFSFDPGRFWLDEPFIQGGRTWVLSKMWGRDTESVLARLAGEFPEAGVSAMRARADA